MLTCPFLSHVSNSYPLTKCGPEAARGIKDGAFRTQYLYTSMRARISLRVPELVFGELISLSLEGILSEIEVKHHIEVSKPETQDIANF